MRRSTLTAATLKAQGCECGPPVTGETCTIKWVRCNARLRWFQDNDWKRATTPPAVGAETEEGTDEKR